MANFKFTVVIIGMILACVAGLEENTRECNLEDSRIVCIDSHSVANDGDEIKLTCGDNGQVITKVLAASFGNPAGTCPDATGLDFGLADMSFSADAGCSAENSAKAILDKCEGKEECTITITEEFTLASSGLASCGGAALNDLNYTLLVQCEDGPDLFAYLVAFVIAVIGVGLGATLTPAALKETWTVHKKGIIVGWLSQFGFMPLIAFIWIKIMKFDDLVSLGVMFVGSAPGGVTSNLFTYFANGNVALSIMMSFASTVCSLFMLPLLVYLYVEKGLGVTDIEIPFVEIIQTLLIAILPVLLGVAIRLKDDKIARYVEKGGSILGVLFILAALVTGILDSPDLFNPGEYPKTWIAAIFFQPTGALFGFTVARAVGLTGPEVRAVTLETAIQNYTIAITIVVFSYDGCERIVALTFVLVSTFFYLVNSVWLVALLRFVHTKYDEPEDLLAVKDEK
eukprot:CAMPEP_0184006506 /NCGR_PEP_ID=MMETSP0954-20121128/737_1 /TAXON_ID=627963 /ORGANISM="Aplanochytrium sp, Strain PBS07" /LENGTH=454 /DNA_ID=CAMNT_0026285075 /DNA_START=153 /DNA_END=1517 /DNA_ORIENTATION=+